MMTGHFSVLSGITLALFSVFCHAAEFIEPPATEEVVTAKRSADEAYDAGQYEEAYRLYLDYLAPIGDKYAQYLIGVMHVEGLGTGHDAAVGAAWLMLAAERGDPRLTGVRDEVLLQLDAQTIERAQSVVGELGEVYGDCAVTRELLARDRKLLKPVTGSRLPPSESLLATVDRSLASNNVLDLREVRRNADKRKRYIREHCR